MINNFNSTSKDMSNRGKMHGKSLEKIQADLSQFYKQREFDKKLKYMLISDYEDNQKGIADMYIKQLIIIGTKYPYKNKKIKIRIQFSDQYPQTPPKMYVQVNTDNNNIKTQPFLHANVYHDNGQICHSLLQDKKSQKQHIKFFVLLRNINDLFYNPNFNNPANLSLGKMHLEFPQTYRKIIEENASLLETECSFQFDSDSDGSQQQQQESK